MTAYSNYKKYGYSYNYIVNKFVAVEPNIEQYVNAIGVFAIGIGIKLDIPDGLYNERILTNIFLSLFNTHTRTLLVNGTTVSVYYFPTAEDDEEGPTFKEKLLDCAIRGIDLFCVWDCCWLWLEFQKYVALLVFDPFVELFITLCIVVNTLFMALDHHEMNKDMDKVLKSGNYVSNA